MAEKDQEKPLTPSLYCRTTTTPLTEDEEISIEFKQNRHRYRKHVICCGIISSVVLILVVILLVLSFTIFHVKNPEINLNSVTLLGLNRTFLPTTNLTVTADISVKNPNAASFTFKNSTANLYYAGEVIGEADVVAGVAKARRTVRMNLTFEVALAEITAVPEFGSDLTAGLIPVRSYASIKGRVKILKVIKKSVTVTMNCSMTVNITSQDIQDQDCKQHVSL